MKIKNETYTRKPVSVDLCYRLYESFRYTQPYDKALPFSITPNELPQESVAVFLISISVLLLKQTFVSVWHLLTSRRLPPY